MRKPLFLDRDGVLNRDIAPYMADRSQLEIFPYTVESLTRLDRAGFDLFVFSNQQGVALRITPSEELDAITEAIQSVLRPYGFEIRRFYYCTALDSEGHPWRKPSPGMILAAGQEFGFDPAGAFVIGDNRTDIEAGRRAGCRPLLVLSGVTPDDGRWTQWESQPEAVFSTLNEAVDYVLK